uniref:Uncharacterized protein n=1 Tax=Noctiluca scintillans TaxID=2966 RepID=A0A7S1A2K1_NOCSC|mmetsp:Transcript_29098/g.76822  ORF Transcript_29098/g.76822 Transcript_29098/m.76822 type:complete len:121 (+) Transcript_29098:90-452(+)|eukprot:CAMPEP_0194485036 /NCGR_PEP_ID=MMETSP0253-20130528/6166_1 /TAXON_ID=2966 /ORGANISM="Noctiluca scintillans" /LENGTH=120 /DNA_ID=CAMNT_0039324951 /DNA_START=74 /DNA_END=436 /DNA_ORIENTATION=-
MAAGSDAGPPAIGTADGSASSLTPGVSESQAYATPREGLAAEKLAVQPPATLGMHEVPLRKYLDEYVLPTLQPGVTAVCEEKPDNPVEWLAYYLLKNNPMNKPAPAEVAAASDTPAAGEA